MLLETKWYLIVRKLIEEHKTISTMESCTGGFIASMITDIPGASNVMKGAFVTYSNEAKVKQGVPEWIIMQYGVYSKETAYSMAYSCSKQYKSDIGIGITGCFTENDVSNGDSCPNRVYIAIFGNDTDYEYAKLFGPFKTRHEYKVAVAEFIADELMKILGISK